MANYWQHRISHMWNISKPLFDHGFLTVGWQGLEKTPLLDSTLQNGLSGFEECAKNLSFNSPNRKSLYRFFSMKPGDIVVVPLFEQQFAIVELDGIAKPISELPINGIQSLDGRYVIQGDSLKYQDDNSIIDLGFFIPIKKESMIIVRRSFASSPLQSHMKERHTNTDVNNLASDIEKARVAKAPLNIHDCILESAAPQVLESICKLTDRRFEQLVQWYMEQSGASHTYIPSKNEKGKSDGADADVVAEFNALGIVIYIQAKRHEGYTSDWAITQISKYKEQKENTTDEFTYIPWVITTAKFSEDVIVKGQAAGVRLIDGLTFAKMILDVGVNAINDISTKLK